MRVAAIIVFSLANNFSFPANAQTSFLQESDPREAIVEACFAPDMGDPVAIYDCLALRANNAVLNSIRPTDECRSIDTHLRFMVREAYKHKGVRPVPQGYVKGPETADAPLPTCEVAAQIIYDITGEEPYWTPCLGYEPAAKKDHFKGCVMSYLQGRERRDEASAMQRFQSAGCDELKRFYYQLAMPAAYKEREWPDGVIRRLPENIEDIDCLEIAAIEF